MPDLLEIIKLAATQAVEAGEPSGVAYGTVKTVNPLTIFIDQKTTLDSDFLVLTRNVTDYTVEMTVDHVTEDTSGGTGEESFKSHSHAYKGKKKFTVHNALKVNDKVIMLKAQGGQEYIVLDKVGGAT